jgi:hypothetical protein
MTATPTFVGLAVKNFPTEKMLSTSRTPKVRQLQAAGGKTDETEKIQNAHYGGNMFWIGIEDYYPATEPPQKAQNC